LTPFGCWVDVTGVVLAPPLVTVTVAVSSNSGTVSPQTDTPICCVKPEFTLGLNVPAELPLLKPLLLNVVGFRNEISGLPVADPGVGQPAPVVSTVAGFVPLPTTFTATVPGLTFVCPTWVRVNVACDAPELPSLITTLGVIVKKNGSSLRIVPTPNWPVLATVPVWLFRGVSTTTNCSFRSLRKSVQT
jgi:hypothetical protein